MVRGLLAAIAVLVSVALAHAERRIALVIGNSDYATLSPIANARHDAALIARTLESLDFEVTSATDANRVAMVEAIEAFGNALKTAGRDAIGLFYFAGHGLQASDTNYVMPVDGQAADRSYLAKAAVGVADVMNRMSAAGNALNLLILDACRDNAFQGNVRPGGRGLAPITPSRGMLVALSAAPGRIGTEGAAENSPYALALAEGLSSSGLSLEDAFKKVRARVESVTAGTQSPWMAASLESEAYLAGSPPKATDVAATARTAVNLAEPAEPGPAADEKPSALPPEPDREAEFWKAALNDKAGGVAVLQAYLEQFPEGRFVPLARILIDADRTAAATEPAQDRAKSDKDRPSPEVAALTSPEARPADRPQGADEMVALGAELEAGSGRVKDPAKAAEWYRKASELGSAEADYRLGLLHYRGEGVERDYGKAADLLLAAAKATHDEAVSALTDAGSLQDRAFVRAVQERLKTLGYYRSAVDGLWGPGSRSAVLALSRGDPITEAKPQTVRRRARPRTPRSVSTPNQGAAPGNRTNPQCARWGKDFNNPGCAFGM